MTVRPSLFGVIRAVALLVILILAKPEDHRLGRNPEEPESGGWLYKCKDEKCGKQKLCLTEPSAPPICKGHGPMKLFKSPWEV
jgi:hypothetical protein